jgi:5'-methylthioadenosine nucleosidase
MSLPLQLSHSPKSILPLLHYLQGAAIGDVFVSTGKLHHDRRIPLPGFDKYGVGYAASVPTPQLQQALALKPGIVTSGDSLDYCKEDMDIMVKHGAAVKEMEAASIAWVAALYKKPMFCVKAITDIVDGDRPTQDEFLENLNAAAAALQGMLPQVLQFIAGKQLSEL